ncbi:hypothetical protein OIU76_027189, partial [Salix suchowensis]
MFVVLVLRIVVWLRGSKGWELKCEDFDIKEGEGLTSVQLIVHFGFGFGFGMSHEFCVLPWNWVRFLYEFIGAVGDTGLVFVVWQIEDFELFFSHYWRFFSINWRYFSINWKES